MIYNDAYAEFAGSRHPKLLGSPVLEGWPEVADFNRHVMEVVLGGGTLSYKDKHLQLNRRGAPEDVWLNLDYSGVRDDMGNPIGVLAIVIETTQWVYAARAQRESEARFRTLADNMAQLAWMADETGAIFWYNKRWFDYTGTALEEMKGCGWHKLHHPDHVHRVVEKMSRHIERAKSGRIRFPCSAATATIAGSCRRAMPIRDESGKVVRWFGTNTDITEHLEEAERNAQLATIVATSADAIISLSDEGIVLSWNPGAEQIFGYTADEIVGKSERVLFADDADREFEEKYRASASRRASAARYRAAAQGRRARQRRHQCCAHAARGRARHRLLGGLARRDRAQARREAPARRHAGIVAPHQEPVGGHHRHGAPDGTLEQRRGRAAVGIDPAAPEPLGFARSSGGGGLGGRLAGGAHPGGAAAVHRHVRRTRMRGAEGRRQRDRGAEPRAWPCTSWRPTRRSTARFPRLQVRSALRGQSNPPRTARSQPAETRRGCASPGRSATVRRWRRRGSRASGTSSSSG